MQIAFTLNGAERRFEVEPSLTLLALLRGEGLIGARFGSETGETGASAVLVDGRLTSTDVMLAAQVDGAEVVTIEALAEGRELHPIQQQFREALLSVDSSLELPF